MCTVTREVGLQAVMNQLLECCESQDRGGTRNASCAQTVEWWSSHRWGMTGSTRKFEGDGRVVSKWNLYLLWVNLCDSVWWRAACDRNLDITFKPGVNFFYPQPQRNGIWTPNNSKVLCLIFTNPRIFPRSPKKVWSYCLASSISKRNPHHDFSIAALRSWCSQIVGSGSHSRSWYRG